MTLKARIKTGHFYLHCEYANGMYGLVETDSKCLMDAVTYAESTTSADGTKRRVIAARGVYDTDSVEFDQETVDYVRGYVLRF